MSRETVEKLIKIKEIKAMEALKQAIEDFDDFKEKHNDILEKYVGELGNYTTAVHERLMEIKDANDDTVDALRDVARSIEKKKDENLDRVEQTITRGVESLKEIVLQETETVRSSVEELKKKFRGRLDQIDLDIVGQEEVFNSILLDLQFEIYELKRKSEEVVEEIKEELDIVDVARKLEGLEGDDKLDYSALKNTPNIPQMMSQHASGGGGVQVNVDGEKIGTYHNLNFTGVTATPENGRVTLAASGGAGTGLTWTTVTDTTEQLASNYGYIINNVSQVELTLPASASAGDVIDIVGFGGGGWILLQNAGQTVYDSPDSSTIGIAGATQADDQYSCITLTAVDSNNWVITDGRGGITFVVVSTSFEFMDSTNFEFMDTSNYQFMA